MSWLNDNVIGEIPEFDQLTDLAQATVKANGMPIITKSTVPEVLDDISEPSEESSDTEASDGK